MPEEDREHDKRILVEMLDNIERQLQIIVYEEFVLEPRRSKFRREFIEILPGPWDEVSSHLRYAQELIERDQVDWKYVEGIGLTGRMLEWKKRMFDETMRQGVVSRFLKVANSFLGSLAKAIPPLELVKEYKEMVEAALKYLRG